jgi:hypothetical protein
MDFLSLCPNCKHLQEFSLDHFESKICEQCHQDLFPQSTELFQGSLEFNQCPHCGSAHLYQQKDFNRKIGIALLGLGIVFSFFTYGVSLLVVTGIDWWLYKKVPQVGCCYLCGSQFRNSAQIQKLPAFDLELYDYYQNIKK